MPKQLSIGSERILIFPYLYTYVYYVQGSVDEWTRVLVSAIFVYLFLLSPFGLCGVILSRGCLFPSMFWTYRASIVTHSTLHGKRRFVLEPHSDCSGTKFPCTKFRNSSEQHKAIQGLLIRHWKYCRLCWICDVSSFRSSVFG